jgi:hypothetical protein
MNYSLRIFLIFLLLSVFDRSQAQNFSVVKANRSVMFNCNNSIRGIKFDSIRVSGIDTIFYSSIKNGLDTGSSCPYMIHPGLLGDSILIKSNGDNIFFNNNGEALLIKTNSVIGDNWVFYQFANGDYFEATLTDKSYETLLQTSDSVKTFTITLKDNGGLPKTHTLNSAQLKISKQYGLVESFNLTGFPVANPYMYSYFPWVSNFNIAGINSPAIGVQDVTEKDIFDFNVGDIFVTKNVDANFYAGTGVIDTTRRTVISKTVSNNNDTITYRIKRFIKRYNASNPSSLTAIIRDTITEVYPLYIKSLLNTLPQALYITDFSVNINSLGDSINNRGSKIYDSWDYTNGPSTSDSCFQDLIGCCSSIKHFYNGLGGPYFDTQTSAIYIYSYSHLLFYQKGSEVWGNQGSFATAGLKSASNLFVTAFPNPFSSFTEITLDNFRPALIILSDLTGREILNDNFVHSYKLQRNNLKPGIYFYTVTDQSGAMGAGKLIVE